MAEQRILTTTEYKAKASAPDKLKVLEQRTKQICERKFVDLMNLNKIYNRFIVQPTEFGGGYGLVTSGIADVEVYDPDPSKRIPDTQKLLKDYKEDITTDIADKVRITYLENEVKKYLSNATEFNAWIDSNYKRLQDAIDAQFNGAIRYLFGATQGIKSVDGNKPLKDALDAMKANFTNTKQYGTNGQANTQKVEDLYYAIIDNYNAMKQYESDEWHLKTNINGFPVTVQDENMLLVMSSKDVQDFNTRYSATTYHPESFKLPNIDRLELPIPQGTAYIIDKRAIQISPRFNETYTEFYKNTLDTDIFLHYHYMIGLFTLYAGVKITKA